MPKKYANISATVNPKNKKYVNDQVAKKQKENSRYCFSHYIDDLLTHLREKSELDNNQQ